MSAGLGQMLTEHTVDTADVEGAATGQELDGVTTCTASKEDINQAQVKGYGQESPGV